MRGPHFECSLRADMSTFLVVLLLGLPLLWPLRRNATFQAVLRHGNHSEVFAYVSDVGSFRALNPTITEITREERSGSEMWVEYWERLCQVAVVRNRGRAHYWIQDGGEGRHSLISRHSTCFLGDFLCLPTDSRLDVTKLSESEVIYREDIFYSCPWALTTFCFHEVAAQRRLIVSHLRGKFSEEPQNLSQDIN